MSTRCNVVLRSKGYPSPFLNDPEKPGELWFYRHSDGYPDGVMPTLGEFMSMLRARAKDRRVKLSPAQREEIRCNPENLSNHALAAKYGVSKRLVQFIRYPERHTLNLLHRQERGGSKIYYDPEKHSDQMRDHRHYKKSLYENNELEDRK